MSEFQKLCKFIRLALIAFFTFAIVLGIIQLFYAALFNN